MNKETRKSGSFGVRDRALGEQPQKDHFSSGVLRLRAPAAFVIAFVTVTCGDCGELNTEPGSWSVPEENITAAITCWVLAQR